MLGSVSNLLSNRGHINGDDLLLLLSNLIESLRAALNTKIQHADSVLEVECSRDSHEISANGELIDPDERDDFAAGADDKVGWPWLGCVGGCIMRIGSHFVRSV